MLCLVQQQAKRVMSQALTISGLYNNEGNSEIRMDKWTKWERDKVHVTLTAWVRWHVDFDGLCVRSARCEGVTLNSDGICDECRDVAKDKALINAVYRVSVCFRSCGGNYLLLYLEATGGRNVAEKTTAQTCSTEAIRCIGSSQRRIPEAACYARRSRSL